MSTVGEAATSSRPRPPRSARRVGYLIGALVDGAILWLVNISPGWQVVPFLTPELGSVLPLVNLSIAVGLVANLVYVLVDPPWLRAAGDAIVPAVGLLPLIALWRVFPFAFEDQSFDWELVVRILLGLGIVGSLIGIVVALATLLRRPWRRRAVEPGVQGTHERAASEG
ncbi:hypothetical protein [Cellulomonas sp. Root137]|uniref:hypothetical protein n=1 Tax=Cellulomonas sp. Root137 TaxID=1736459 RepID=UPI000A784EBB|nr:hypothetical protein [Cellulomonas sp. Root137]